MYANFLSYNLKLYLLFFNKPSNIIIFLQYYFIIFEQI